MSWLFSRALVEEYLAGTCSDGEQSAPSSGNPIPQAYCAPDRMTAFSRLSRFGMTFKPLTDSRGEDLLTWYREGFLARTYPQQERAQESPEVNQVCGNTWHELLMKYDPDSHSWKTVRCLFPEELQWSSVTLPTWGMTVNGALFQHQTAVRPISGIGFGSEPNNEKLPTPQATDHISKRTSASWKAKGGVNFSLSNPEIQMMWPTPTSTLGTNGGLVTPSKGREGGTLIEALSARTLWPTPAARDCKGANNREHCETNGTGRKHMDQLANAVAHPDLRFATPQTRDFRTGSTERWDNPERSRNLNDQIGGQLNPTWVEWLMGWPLGWTDLKPLETGKWRQWLRQHGAC